MRFSRAVTVKINRALDELIPPWLRDARFFLPQVFRLLFGQHARLFQTFKEWAVSMTDADYASAYQAVDPVLVQRTTDLNEDSIRTIQEAIQGSTVLEVGCGHGYLASLLARTYAVTATDMQIRPSTREAHPTITFQEARMEQLPFADASFDTVVCAHTLEHAPYFMQSVAELRRVARKRLIIVVPRQRPYRYTFDLHLHFFPYPHSLLHTLRAPGVQHRCDVIGGDLFYVQDIS